MARTKRKNVWSQKELYSDADAGGAACVAAGFGIPCAAVASELAAEGTATAPVRVLQHQPCRRLKVKVENRCNRLKIDANLPGASKK